jgi:hypothetical protein
MNRKDRRVPWLLSWRQRAYKSVKIRKTENEILNAKKSGDWLQVIKLKNLLRKVWWGYKRIKDK